MNKVKIAWYGLHTGEEPPLNPAGGIFFTGCDLRCVFCQNYQISHGQIGKVYTTEDLVNIMLELQNSGVKNIDLVSPNGWYKIIKSAIIIARERGLNIPIVWNSNGYERLEVLKEMKGLVNIYLPDFKYGDNTLAERYSGIKNYIERVVENIREMLAQVGPLKIENEVAKSGVIIRHMVLPNNLKNSFSVLEKIALIDKDVFVSLMNQYSPLYRADKYPELTRMVSEEEFEQVYDFLLMLGVNNGWVQGEKSAENLVPDFKKDNPFTSG